MSLTKFFLASAMACLSAAQANDDHVYLLASDPDSGTISYTILKEDGDASRLRKEGDWHSLIVGRKYPTYTAYDFTHEKLYICDCDQILQYEITFLGDSITA